MCVAVVFAMCVAVAVAMAQPDDDDETGKCLFNSGLASPHTYSVASRLLRTSYDQRQTFVNVYDRFH